MGQLPELDEYARLRNWVARKYRKANAIVSFSARYIVQHVKSLDPDSPIDFISRFKSAAEKYPNIMTDTQMIDYATTNVSAGSDTTAIILRDIFFQLLNDKEGRLELLQQETKAVLRSRAHGDFDRHISWNEAYKMRYLQACIKESMRIHPALGQILPRVVPAGGITLCGKFLPEGTEVGCNAWTVHRDPAVFGEYVDEWRPERWLDADEEKVKAMDRYSFIFGAGSRTCKYPDTGRRRPLLTSPLGIGRHIAMLELSKLIPELFRTYEIHLVDASRYRDHCRWLVVQFGLDVTMRLRDQRQWLTQA